MTRLAAIFGVLVSSFSAIFVRLARATPDTAVFFRSLYALPALILLWLGIDRTKGSVKLRGLAFASGVIVGLDLAFWHPAID